MRAIQIEQTGGPEVMRAADISPPSPQPVKCVYATLPSAAARRYPLEEAPQAHRDLEARTTTGTGILLP